MRNHPHNRPCRAHVGLAGRYRLDKHKVLSYNEDGTPKELGPKIEVLPWFDNLITNTGMDSLGNEGSGDRMAWCQIGTSSAAPAFTDTNLGARVSAAAIFSGSFGGSIASFVWRRGTYRFAAGTINGKNLTEVGVGTSGTSTLFSRALLKNSSAVPTAITLDADEVLDVTYEVRAYLTATSQTGMFVIDGVTTEVGMYPLTNAAAPWSGERLLWVPMCTRPSSSDNAHIFFANQVLSAAPATAIGGSTVGAMTWVLGAYTAGTYQREVTLTLGLTQGNFAGGIGGAAMGSSTSPPSNQLYRGGFGQFGFSFNPKINKDATKTANIKFLTTWGRYTP